MGGYDPSPPHTQKKERAPDINVNQGLVWCGGGWEKSLIWLPECDPPGSLRLVLAKSDLPQMFIKVKKQTGNSKTICLNDD